MPGNPGFITPDPIEFELKPGQVFEVDGVRCELMRPPTIRGLGTQEELVVAFLMEVETGRVDVKG